MRMHLHLISLFSIKLQLPQRWYIPLKINYYLKFVLGIVLFQ